MYIYKVTFTGGIVSKVRANSPKEAHDIASVFGIVSHIKWLR